MREIELLAPAKDLESGKIAVDYGADAVYIGGPSFGARQAVGNTVEDIKRLAEYAHAFGAKVYAALNTLIYEDELPQAEKVAEELVGAGVDALIIQDMAFLRMGLRGVEFHSSTQMCNTSAGRVKFLENAGFARAILERGLTLEEVKEIRKETDIELECFVHGAICVGYSGRCYLSRSMGARSGNRGDCGQPCRMTYDLVNESGEVLVRNKHLLSVMDLDLSDKIPDMLDAGVTSFKIEGRLKEQDYLKNIVSYYRAAIDRALVSRSDMKRSSVGRSEVDFVPDPSRTFSRGTTRWMFDGKASGAASFDTPKATGAYIGRVAKVSDGCFVMETAGELSAGDGICFYDGSVLEGTNVNRIEGQKVYVGKMSGITAGTKIFRNHDHAFSVRLKKSKVRRLIDTAALLQISNENIALTLTDEEGVSAVVSVGNTFEQARDENKALETILAQVLKSGDTIFGITHVKVERQDKPLPFIPVSQINALRRNALSRLLENRSRRYEELRAEKEYPEENTAYPYPVTELQGDANVTNSSVREFYRQHGVGSVEEGYDIGGVLVDKQVMLTPYCVRRELDECLKNKKHRQGYEQELFLRRGNLTYQLRFDCSRCLMGLVKK